MEEDLININIQALLCVFKQDSKDIQCQLLTQAERQAWYLDLNLALLMIVVLSSFIQHSDKVGPSHVACSWPAEP